MIIAIVDGGRLGVFSSETGRIVFGEVNAGAQLGRLESLHEKVNQMSQSQNSLADEVKALKANMADLHGVVLGIQGRLDNTIQNAGNADSAVVADLHGINDDLKSVIAGLRPAAGASDGKGAAQAPAPVPAPAVPAGDAPQPEVGPVFNAADTTPNAPGGRNTSGLPDFDPNQPETT